MTRIYLIRHAQSEGNLYRRILGWYDGHVTSSGRAQITALKNRFLEIPVDAVYSSDLSRAWETAQAVALPQKLDIHPEPAFRELHIGEFTNIPYGDLHYHHPDLYDALFSPVGSQGWGAFSAGGGPDRSRLFPSCPPPFRPKRGHLFPCHGHSLSPGFPSGKTPQPIPPPFGRKYRCILLRTSG